MISRSILKNKFKIFILLSLIILIIELFGSIFTNSLALLSDAGHVLIDLLALLLTYFSIWLSQKSPNKKFTFGFYRVEILAAIINGITLSLITFFIFYQAINRLISHVSNIKSGEMLIISILGFIANLYVVIKIPNYEKENLNIKSAYLHVLSDTLSSIGVIIASILIILTGKYIIDSIISIVIGLFILLNSIKLIKDSIYILMETVPNHINIEEISNDIKKINGVKEVHNLNLWSISSDIYALNSHILINSENIKSVNNIISEINKMLKSKYNITYTIIQSECEKCVNHSSNTIN